MSEIIYNEEIHVCFREKVIHNVLSNFCKKVLIKSAEGKDSYDVYFPRIDLSNELKRIDDLDRSMKDDSLFDQIIRMGEKHKHSLVLIYVNGKKPDIYQEPVNLNTGIYDLAMSKVLRHIKKDPFSNKEDDPKTYMKQLLGFTAECLALSNLEGIMFFEDPYSLGYWVCRYAWFLENAKKIVNKKYVLKRIPFDENQSNFVNTIRCIVEGIGLQKAVNISEMMNIKDLVITKENKRENIYNKLNDVNGIGDILANRIIEKFNDVKHDKLQRHDE